jgi:Pycsar effector protein
MEERLRYIFANVNDWLRFAEKKNAAIVVAATSLGLAITQFAPSLKSTGVELWVSIVSVGLLFGAGVLSLLSFVPSVRFVWSIPLRQPSDEENLFFFGHVAHYSATEYLQALYRATAASCGRQKLEVDLAGQIITNSQIALRKFWFSRCSTWLLFSGATCACVAALLHIWGL